MTCTNLMAPSLRRYPHLLLGSIVALTILTSRCMGQSTQPTLPFHMLVGEGDLRGAQDRLAKGDRIDSTDNDGKTALHWAARSWQKNPTQRQMIEFLVSKGADPNAKDKIGYTPLHAAADGGNVLVAEALIKAGARIDELTIYGRTPLHQAALRGHIEIVNLLLKSGANPGVRNRDGETPIGLAVKHENWDVVESLAHMLNTPGASSQPTTARSSTTRSVYRNH